MNRKVPLVVIHIFGCLTFLALPYIFASDGLAKLAELKHNTHEQRNLLSYLLTTAFFYTNYYLLIPRLFFVRKYLIYGMSVLGCFLLIELTLVQIIQIRPGPPPMFQGPFPPPPGPMDRQRRPPFPESNQPPMPPDEFNRAERQQPGLPSEFNQTFFLVLVGFLMSLALRINDRWRETEQEKIQTELSYLKAQINPHFLFNTLNSIYSLAIIESPATADAIVKLSSFLRYVIQESPKNQVSLRSELDYIRHYIDLQKLRLGDTVQIDFTIEGNANGKQITPLLLISLIENAFKYGVSPEEQSAIQIRISIDGNNVHCHVFNNKVRVFQPVAVASGIGLANTKTRLQFMYPDRHQLIINDKPDSFTVDLSIQLS